MKLIEKLPMKNSNFQESKKLFESALKENYKRKKKI